MRILMSMMHDPSVVRRLSTSSNSGEMHGILIIRRRLAVCRGNICQIR